MGGGSGGESLPKAWTHPSGLTDDISPDGEDAYVSQAAMDSSGNAIVVWVQGDGAQDQIFKSEYRSGAWTHPANLTDNISPDGWPTSSAQVAMDNNGNAIVVWQQSDGADIQIFKSEYRSGVWTHPANLADNISPGGENAADPMVAMDDDGNAIIVWRQSDGASIQIFKSEYRAGAWTHPANLADNISPDAQNAANPRVAMDDNGNAVIVWQQSDSANTQIFKSEYRTGAWTHPANLADNISPDAQNAINPRLAMDDNGNAIIAWQQSDATNTQIFKSEYRTGAWTHPANLADNISPDAQNATNSRVAMDNNGNAIIAWQQSDGASGQIFKSEYRAGAWTHPANLADNISPDGQFAYDSQVAMSDDGSAVIIWTQYTGANDQTFMSHYLSGAWDHPANLADDITPDGSDAYNPQVTMNADGAAIIVWDAYTPADGEIFMSEFR